MTSKKYSEKVAFVVANMSINNDELGYYATVHSATSDAVYTVDIHPTLNIAYACTCKSVVGCYHIDGVNEVLECQFTGFAERIGLVAVEEAALLASLSAFDRDGWNVYQQLMLARKGGTFPLTSAHLADYYESREYRQAVALYGPAYTIGAAMTDANEALTRGIEQDELAAQQARKDMMTAHLESTNYEALASTKRASTSGRDAMRAAYVAMFNPNGIY